ncbi:hypothetical protein GOL35_30265 [Sinorhizobium medicae]|nr:hypothetical protein [Sinorhizobium medicae]
MKQTFVFLLTIFLSSCTFNGTTPPNATVPPGDTGGESPSETVNSGKMFAKRICGFVPTARTILEILDLGIPNVSKGAIIAEKICEAIGNTKGLKAPMYKGVRIEGQFE